MTLNSLKGNSSARQVVPAIVAPNVKKPLSTISPAGGLVINMRLHRMGLGEATLRARLSTHWDTKGPWDLLGGSGYPWYNECPPFFEHG